MSYQWVSGCVWYGVFVCVWADLLERVEYVVWPVVVDHRWRDEYLVEVSLVRPDCLVGWLLGPTTHRTTHTHSTHTQHALQLTSPPRTLFKRRYKNRRFN